MKLVLLLIIVSILLESTLITLPLTLLLILFSAVFFRNNDIFALAFFAGIMLDIISYKPIGFSSLFFVTIVFLVYLYQNKFEVETLHFVAILSFLGSFIYLITTGVSYSLPQAIISTLVISISFFVFQKTNKKIKSYG